MPEQNLSKFKNIDLRTFKNKVDLGSIVYGKVMPQAIELEEAVLGAILIDKEGMSTVVEVLKPESFYKDAHVEIFKQARSLFENTLPVDLLTLHEKLKKEKKLEEVGGIEYLINLTNKVASTANLEFHARIIAQKYIQRELIRVSSHTIKDSYEDEKDVFELLDEAEQNLYDITDQNLNTGYEKLGALAIKVSKEIEMISKNDDSVTGVPSGFDDLDKITSGWQKSDFIIIAARPGMGKTAFALSLARNAAKMGKGVGIFSLEMSSNQLVQRILSMETEINSRALRNGQLKDFEWKKLNDAVTLTSEMPMYIDDTPAINIFELRAKCRRLKQNHDIQLILVDYLQLMQSSSNQKRMNREQEISTISRSLKTLAKELNIPVIALSQLSRAVETRGGIKKPVLSDLRESGAIEQDADIVTFIYRPDYYDMKDQEFETPPDQAEIIISKHRNGALGSVFLKFKKEFVKFEAPDHSIDFDDPLSTLGRNALGSGIITRPSKINLGEDDDTPF